MWIFFLFKNYDLIRRSSVILSVILKKVIQMKHHFIFLFTCLTLSLHSGDKEAGLNQDNDRISATFGSVKEIYALGVNEFGGM